MNDYFDWWKKRIKSEPGLRLRIKDIKKKVPGFRDWINGKKQFKWLDNRWFTLLRDNYTCQHCGYQSRDGLHVHHIYGRGNGDNERPEQLMTFCSVCHPGEMDNDFWNCMNNSKKSVVWELQEKQLSKIRKEFLEKIKIS